MHAAPTARKARLIKWAAVPAALVISGAIIAPASYSAFTSTTTNPSSNWAAGTIAISDDDANTALLSVTGLKPGSIGSKCIVVSSTGSLASAVKLYATAPATTNALNGSITLVVTQGTGGSFGSCVGFTPLATGSVLYSGLLSTLGTTATNFSNGLGNWAPTGSATETRTYQFSYTVDSAAPNSTQGGTASLGFTWEAQNS